MQALGDVSVELSDMVRFAVSNLTMFSLSRHRYVENNIVKHVAVAEAEDGRFIPFRFCKKNCFVLIPSVLLADPAGDDNPTVTLAPALLEAVKKVVA